MNHIGPAIIWKSTRATAMNQSVFNAFQEKLCQPAEQPSKATEAADSLSVPSSPTIEKPLLLTPQGAQGSPTCSRKLTPMPRDIQPRHPTIRVGIQEHCILLLLPFLFFFLKSCEASRGKCYSWIGVMKKHLCSSLRHSYPELELSRAGLILFSPSGRLKGSLLKWRVNPGR